MKIAEDEREAWLEEVTLSPGYFTLEVSIAGPRRPAAARKRKTFCAHACFSRGLLALTETNAVGCAKPAAGALLHRAAGGQGERRVIGFLTLSLVLFDYNKKNPHFVFDDGRVFSAAR